MARFFKIETNAGYFDYVNLDKVIRINLAHMNSEGKVDASSKVFSYRRLTIFVEPHGRGEVKSVVETVSEEAINRFLAIMDSSSI